MGTANDTVGHSDRFHVVPFNELSDCLADLWTAANISVFGIPSLQGECFFVFTGDDAYCNFTVRHQNLWDA